MAVKSGDRGADLKKCGRNMAISLLPDTGIEKCDTFRIPGAAFPGTCVAGIRIS